MSLTSKIRWFVEYARFFRGISDVFAFSSLQKSGRTQGDEVGLNIRRLPGAKLICRPGTSDAQVLLDVFWGKYHLPDRNIPKNPIIFDLGANAGYSCFDFATAFPNARVIGVELDADNADLARRNTSILGQSCRILHAAVWHEDSEVTYTKNGEEWGYQVSGDQDGNLAAKVTVPAYSIDTLMRQAGVDWVDYIKMDIEGAEDNVLDPDALWLQRTGALNVELHPPATFEKCHALLSQAGFTCAPSTRHPSAIVAWRR